MISERGSINQITLCMDRQAGASIVDPDQMPKNAASNQGLHCVLTQPAILK